MIETQRPLEPAGAHPDQPAAATRGPDVYGLVTERIIEALEAGAGIAWKKPWATSRLPRNLMTGREYRGMNILLLSLGQPYTSPCWLTFKQALDLSGHVRKGEKGSLVTFWKFQRQPKRDE